jgi:CDP-glucose 4,6-dehydratase
MTAQSLKWYRGRRVFVTGHTGFKGAWLSLWLQKLGADVTGYALAADSPSLFEQANVGAGMTSVIGDIRDRAALEKAMRACDPEVVIHMAAQSLVRRSYAAPVETFETNVIGTVNVLETARSLPSLKSIVNVTSDKCYENRDEGKAFTEDSALGGADPYSASKGCAEIAGAAYARSFFAEGAATVTSGRAGNVIGGCDWAQDRIIPDLMRAAAAGDEAFIRRPEAVRPWQHVLEPLRGYLMLAQRAAVHGQRFSGSWNFGPDAEDAVTVRTVAEHVTSFWPGLKIRYADQTSGPHEAHLLHLDCAKAARELGWRPVLSLRDAIAMTVGLYRAVKDDIKSLRTAALSQIDDFERRAATLNMETENA